MFLHKTIGIIEADKPAHFAGLAATIVGIISFLPVIYVVYKTKTTKNFPIKTLLLALISNLLWIYYGAAKNKVMDKQLILMGTLYFFIYSFILYTKVKH